MNLFDNPFKKSKPATSEQAAEQPTRETPVIEQTQNRAVTEEGEFKTTLKRVEKAAAEALLESFHPEKKTKAGRPGISNGKWTGRWK